MIKKILTLFIITRLYLLLIGILALQIISPAFIPEAAWQGWQSHPLVNMWCRWDSGWYLSIIEKGYVVDTNKHPDYIIDEGIDLSANKAFFPLYPIIVKTITPLTGDPLLTGVILSNIFLLIAAIYLFKLVKLDHSKKTATQTVFYLLIYPVTFILSGFFTESIFLLLTLSAFYHARKKEWTKACIAGLLSSMTRSLGILLIIPLTIEYLKTKKKTVRDSASLLLIPLGAILFFTYLYQITGDPLSFFNTQKAHWQTSITEPISYTVLIFMERSRQPDAWSRLAFVIFSFSALTYMIKARFRASYIVFSLYAILLPVASKKLFSMPRFTLVAFPIYLVLARLSDNPSREKIIVVIFASIMTLYMILWTIGSTHVI